MDKIKKILMRTCCAAWLLKLVPIPVGIITAKLMAEVVTDAVGGDIKGVLNISGILMTVIIGMKIFGILTGIVYKKASSQALHKCKILLYRQFLSNPLHMLYQSEHGDAIEKLDDDFGTITGKSLSLYPGFWTGIVTAAVYFFFIVLQSPYTALSLLIISVLQIIPPGIVKKYMEVNYDNCRDIEAKITDFIIEGYRGFATIKLYHLKKWWLDKMKELHKKYTKIGNRSIYTVTAENALGTLLDNILKYGIYGIIGLFVLLKNSSLEVGIQAIALSGELFAAIKTVFFSIPDFAVAKAAQKRLSRWFDKKEDNTELIQSSDIQLYGVGYSYENKIVFDDISTSFSGSQICVIHGSNGIGKSTLFRLIIGLLQCNTGEIKIGGVDTGLLSDENYPGSIFYLPQDNTSFDFSAKDLYEMIMPDRAESVNCCALDFGLTEELLNDSPISELSGGERKKVFLALAFALNAPILLLDEPTNSLDTDSKVVLCEKLKNRSGGALIITRDSIFDSIAERVYTMEKGGICLEKVR